MLFKILLVLLIIIIFIVTFINKKYIDFVQEHSQLLKRVNEINNKYYFKDVDEFNFVYYYDNEDFYNDIDTKDYLNYAYLQIAYTILESKKTEDREYTLLELIKDNYPKYVLTIDFLIQKRNDIIYGNIAEFIRNNLQFN